MASVRNNFLSQKSFHYISKSRSGGEREREWNMIRKEVKGEEQNEELFLCERCT